LPRKEGELMHHLVQNNLDLMMDFMIKVMKQLTLVHQARLEMEKLGFPLEFK
jgi:hypothetical protein